MLTLNALLFSIKTVCGIQCCTLHIFPSKWNIFSRLLEVPLNKILLYEKTRTLFFSCTLQCQKVFTNSFENRVFPLEKLTAITLSHVGVHMH